MQTNKGRIRKRKLNRINIVEFCSNEASACHPQICVDLLRFMLKHAQPALILIISGNDSLDGPRVKQRLRMPEMASPTRLFQHSSGDTAEPKGDLANLRFANLNSLCPEND